MISSKASEYRADLLAWRSSIEGLIESSESSLDKESLVSETLCFVNSITSIKDDQSLVSVCENSMFFRGYKLKRNLHMIIGFIGAIEFIAIITCFIVGFRKNIMPVKFIAVTMLSSYLVGIFVDWCLSILLIHTSRNFDIEREKGLQKANKCSSEVDDNVELCEREKFSVLTQELKSNYIPACNRAALGYIILFVFMMSVMTVSIFVSMYFKLEQVNKGGFYSLAILSGILFFPCCSLLATSRAYVLRKQEGVFVKQLFEQKEEALNAHDTTIFHDNVQVNSGNVECQLLSTKLEDHISVKYPESLPKTPLAILSSVVA